MIITSIQLLHESFSTCIQTPVLINANNVCTGVCLMEKQGTQHRPDTVVSVRAAGRQRSSTDARPSSSRCCWSQ